MTPIYTVFRWFPAKPPGKKVKKLVFQALSEEGTVVRHKREGGSFIYSKTLCTIAGGGTIVTF